jgi:preprotein translocase subunit SecE
MSWKENRVAKYLLEAKEELGKVIWPSREQIVTHSLLVIGISIGMAAYFGLVDWLLSKGLEQILTFRR